MLKHTVTLIRGDGIGPEVVDATRRIIDATGVHIEWELCEAGAEVFKKGLDTGVPKDTIDSIIRNKVALKGPLETPVGYGAKSANVTLRKMFETYGNIRPVREFPGVITPYTGRNIDIVIVRENVEDLYAGIEYMQTPSVSQCLKIISRMGCEKIIRLAFEFARASGRKKVHCATKANIMKFSEGLMKQVFEEIAPQYPDIESYHIIVDNCAHQLVKKPEQFDVIVTTNMNGDILSDLSSALVGGLGFAPGANIGDEYAIFEAVHGSAPKYAGKNTINPTAVLMSGIMMLRHLGEFEAAETIEQSLFITIGNDNVYTKDVKQQGSVSTSDFTNGIIKNLGKSFPGYVKGGNQKIQLQNIPHAHSNQASVNRCLVGVDIFIESSQHLLCIGENLENICADLPFKLKVISNRGIKVYPFSDCDIQPSLIDAFRCRFVRKDESMQINDFHITNLLDQVSKLFNWHHIEKLNIFNGKEGFSKVHGEN